jgi:PAS domain-containing protein
MTLDFRQLFGGLLRALRPVGGNGGNSVAGSSAGPGLRADEPDIERMLETFRGLIARLSQDGTEIGEICTRAEQKAARYALLSETVVESVTSGILVIDSAGRVLLTNSAAKRILDVGPDTDLAGTELGTLLADGRDLRHLVQRCIDTATNASREIIEITTPAGKVKQLGISTSCVGPGRGAVEAVIMVFTSLGEESIRKEQAGPTGRPDSARMYLRGILDSYDLVSNMVRVFARIEDKSNLGTLSTLELREFSGSLRCACDAMMAFAIAAGVDDSIPEIVDLNKLLESVIAGLTGAEQARVRLRMPASLPSVKSVRKVLDVGLNLLIRGCISQSAGLVEVSSGPAEGDEPTRVTINVKESSPSRVVKRIEGSLRDIIGAEDQRREIGLFLLSKLPKDSNCLQIRQAEGVFHFSMAFGPPIVQESGPGGHLRSSSDRG